ncbi:DUF418 domain-containing protein [Ammonicoccus fulvus]|uniref:DUF418 domain-containing protein n=1 Tax=Ammonicoccus fulvus TaxID=3138240 RepID=A0ABZ3FM63_9ACTN
MMSQPAAVTAPPSSTNTPARALAPDLARGVMLLLIAIANSAWYLWGHPGGFTSAHPTDGSELDRVARAVIAITIDGRVYPMFALLFAYGMVQFARSRAARGIQPRDIKRMLRKRHLAMLLLGFLHAALLFGGDVLGAYAVLGLIFVPLLFEAKVKTLKLVLWILLAYAAVSAISAIGAMLWLDSMGIDAAGGPEISNGPEIPGLADLMSGFDNYLIAMAARVGMWLIATPAVLLAGTLPACLLFGWLLARHQVLEHPERYRRQLTMLAVGGIAVGWLTGLPVGLAHLDIHFMSTNLEIGYVNVSYVGGLFAGAGYAALFALIAGRMRRPGVVTRSVAAVGKRSLSSYLWQSLIFAPLLAAWGFGLGARINTLGVVAIAAGIWLSSVIISAVLEARGARGPAEVLLRKMTYLPPDKLTPAPQPGRPMPPAPHTPTGLPQHPGQSGS